MSESESDPIATKTVQSMRRQKQLMALAFPERGQQQDRTLVHVRKADDAEPGRSQSVTEDPVAEMLRNGEIIEPPLDLLSLSVMPEHNSELVQVVEAMQANIDGFGHHFVSRVDVTKADPETNAKVLAEKVRLTNFFANLNLRSSFTKLRMMLRADIETTGNGFLEVIRDAAGRISGFEHLPAYQLRLTPQDHEPILVEQPTLELQIDGSVQVKQQKSYQRFRRFVQSRIAQLHGHPVGTTASTTYRVRWFKEFGDPRHYNNSTGEVHDPDVQKVGIGEAEVKSTPLSADERANEVIHFKRYCPRSPYGIPRFVGNLLSIVGDRAAEEINFTTFKNNNIPSMAVLVSNGQLTDGSIQRIEKFTEANIQGSDNYSKFLVIEAEGAFEGDDQGNSKIAIQPLTESQHKDALFQNYSRNNQDKIRRSFRLPPIFVGRADEYTRATADSSRRLADEQVFAPERNDFDDFMNRRLFPAMEIIYHQFKSNSPNTTDNTELVSLLSNAEKTGAMTPRIGRVVMEDVLGTELPPFKEGKFDPDLPYSLQMAEAVKNKADPTEPGQQFTAMKALKMLGIGLDGEEGSLSILDHEMLHSLTKMRARVEKLWARRLDGEGSDVP